MSTASSWYALYTKAFWEKKICSQLERMGVESYCPVQKVQRQWSDRKKIIEEPLFRSYVLVKTELKMLSVLKQVTGISQVVSFNGRPAVIRESEVRSIREMVSSYSNISVEPLDYNVNDNVRILSGPFRDISGLVHDVKKRTVRVLLPSFGYMLVAEFQKSNLQLAEVHAS